MLCICIFDSVCMCTIVFYVGTKSPSTYLGRFCVLERFCVLVVTTSSCTYDSRCCCDGDIQRLYAGSPRALLLKECACVYVCMCVYMYVYVCSEALCGFPQGTSPARVCMRVCMYVCVCMYRGARAGRTCVYVCERKSTNMKQACMYAHSIASLYVYTNTPTRTCTSMHVH